MVFSVKVFGANTYNRAVCIREGLQLFNSAVDLPLLHSVSEDNDRNTTIFHFRLFLHDRLDIDAVLTQNGCYLSQHTRAVQSGYAQIVGRLDRSEERRVGKECGSR